MATTFTINDVELLGYTSPKELSIDDRSPYAIFEATAIAGLEEIKARFIYLKSSCTLSHARTAHRQNEPLSEHTYVVKPASLRLTDHSLREIFGNNIRISEYEELVWKKLKVVFDQYLESLSDVPTEEYFISPRSTNNEIDDLESWMIDYMRGGRSEDDGTVLVLSAHAGVGKTTLSRSLLHELRKRATRVKTIPIYVEAQHWGKLHLDSIDGLWDIIDNSLRSFSSSLSLREDLFYYALRQGYLSFIFDGFDELCGHKTSQLDAIAVLQQLTSIAAQSEARILVTTRTLYWDSEIETLPDNVKVVKLDAFNTQQAKRYFSKYFRSTPSKQNQALNVYRELVRGSHRPRQDGGVRTQFVNLPLCVAMVANYVKSGGGPITADARRVLLEDFLLNICRREKERKNLNTSEVNQLSSFQELAILDGENMNPEFEFEILQATDFDDQDINKLVDHPLLRSSDSTKYRFSYDFLGPYFRALAIAKGLDDSTKKLSQMIDIMAREAEGKGYISEQLCGILEPNSLDNVARVFQEIVPKNKKAASFLFHICRNLIDETQVTTRAERSQHLFSALAGTDFLKNRLIKRWSFYGILERLDFRGITFDQCRFERVAFRHCLADETTRFTDCIFTGDLDIKPTSDWSNVDRKGCRDIFPASVVWEEVLGRALGSREDRVLEILRIALSRFWYHGRPRMSMRLDDWNKGVLGKRNLAEEILEAMLKVKLVQKVAISGVSEGGIAFDKSSMNDLRNYMDNQQIQGKIREVFRLLVNAGQ